MDDRPPGMLPSDLHPDRFGFWRALAFALLLLATVAVTLPRQEFSNGGENLLLTTATETRRTAHWLMPTLNGSLRVNKPPFPMWLSAVLISDATMRGLDSADPLVREAAIRRLNWQVRWPALAASALAVLVAYELGKTLSGRMGGMGWMAAGICASQILFLRNARNATTDVQLMLWVSIANLAMAKAMLEGWRWRAAIGTGLALGLALMSKGPVALVQTAAPALVLMGFDLWRRWREAGGSLRPGRRINWAPIGVGTVVTLAVGLPWYLLILTRSQGGVMDRWLAEVTREDATGMPPGVWYGYVIFLPLLAPWTVFFVAGVVTAIRDWLARGDEQTIRRGRGMLLAVLLVFVPLLVMSFFRDRKDRYTLPMTIPAAVLAARGVAEYLRARAKGEKIAWLSGIHWGVVAVMVLGVPIAGAVSLRTLDGEPWYTPLQTGVAAAVAAVGVGIGVWLDRNRARGLVVVTFALLMALQVMFLYGYRRSDEGRSEMKPLADEIWARYPTATVWTTGPRHLPIPPDLPLYLNRPVPWIDTVQEAGGAPRPWIVVIRQRGKEPAPPAPHGWTALTPVRRDNNHWHAFVLP